MTDQEKAIVMAYTGFTMLTGEKLFIFYGYVEQLLGRPVWSHELATLEEEIREKSKDDFVKICEDRL